MRLVSLMTAFVASSTLAIYVLTCSVNNTPPAPVHPIVGKWRQVIQVGRLVSGDIEATCEYTAEGVVIFDSIDPKFGHRCEKGTYYVVGDKRHTHMPQRRADMMDSVTTIRFIGHDRIQYADEKTKPGEECECIRISP